MTVIASPIFGGGVDANIIVQVDFQQSVPGLMADYNEVRDKSPYAHVTTYASGAEVRDGSDVGEPWTPVRDRYLQAQPTTGEIYLAEHPEMELDGDFTIEWWQARATIIQPNINSGVLGFNTQTGWGIYHLSHSQGGDMILANNNSEVLRVEVAAYTEHLTWHHCAFVRDSGTIVLYHRGVARGSVVDSQTLLIQSVGTPNFTIGGISNLSGYMPIDDVRVTKDVRYSGNFTPPNPGWS